MAAALNILAEEGYVGFSVTRVAARAGVSNGALEHYFRTRNELFAAATRYTMERAIKHARLLAGTAARSPNPIAKFLSDSEHFFFTPVFSAMMEVVIATRSDRALAKLINPIVQDARNVLNGIWTDTLHAAGYPQGAAQRFVELTHYLMRGMFVVSNWLPYTIDRSAVMRQWLALAPAALGAAPRAKRIPRRVPGRRKPPSARRTASR